MISLQSPSLQPEGLFYRWKEGRINKIPEQMKNTLIYLIISLFVLPGCSRLKDPEPEEEGRILILMYHRIVTGDATNLYERSITDFEADLRFIRENGIKVISFSDLENVTDSHKMPDGHSVIITFDDGDYSWYTLARSLLLKYNMNATFFLWVYMINHDSFLTWKEVEQMSYYTLEGGERPFSFGSHTFSHPYLHGQKENFENETEYNLFLDYELGVSKSLIESHIPEKVTGLALPFGDGYGDPEIIEAAERNGYNFIRTSKYGAIGDPDIDLFALPSLPVLSDTPSDRIGFYLGI